jgi:hypothetical protein
VVPELVSELRHMQTWLELDNIEVSDRGDLAASLRRSVSSAAIPRKSQLKRAMPQ